jgi:hypothetical protein
MQLRRQRPIDLSGHRGFVMIAKAIQPARLDELAAMVGLSVKDANKDNVSAMLFSIREGVMTCADALAADYPPALVFDPHWHRT